MQILDVTGLLHKVNDMLYFSFDFTYQDWHYNKRKGNDDQPARHYRYIVADQATYRVYISVYGLTALGHYS